MVPPQDSNIWLCYGCQDTVRSEEEVVECDKCKVELVRAPGNTHEFQDNVASRPYARRASIVNFPGQEMGWMASIRDGFE